MVRLIPQASVHAVTTNADCNDCNRCKQSYHHTLFDFLCYVFFDFFQIFKIPIEQIQNVILSHSFWTCLYRFVQLQTVEA